VKSERPYLLSLAVVLLLATLAHACPNCQEAIASDPAQQGLARGIYYSILFMMSMPFFIFGGLCSYFYYLVCCDRAEKAKHSGSPLQASGELPVAG
jgi:heme/copper-type cytochrome/quinol oxidase subunit 2